jgi:hypothetical protein
MKMAEDKTKEVHNAPKDEEPKGPPAQVPPSGPGQEPEPQDDDGSTPGPPRSEPPPNK